MDFRILGPLEVVGDAGPLRLGGPKQHAVLAREDALADLSEEPSAPARDSPVGRKGSA
jgi:hypothetical protein